MFWKIWINHILSPTTAFSIIFYHATTTETKHFQRSKCPLRPTILTVSRQQTLANSRDRRHCFRLLGIPPGILLLLMTIVTTEKKISFTFPHLRYSMCLRIKIFMIARGKTLTMISQNLRDCDLKVTWMHRCCKMGINDIQPLSMAWIIWILSPTAQIASFLSTWASVDWAHNFQRAWTCFWKSRLWCKSIDVHVVCTSISDTGVPGG